MGGCTADPARSAAMPFGSRPTTPSPEAPRDEVSSSWIPTAIAAFLLLGGALRIFRYGQNLPLWSDECFLAVNFIRRGYHDLLQPLDNGQIAPLLYLWAERLVIDLTGFSEWSLRLFPLFCGLC